MNLLLYVDGVLASLINSLLAVFILWYKKRDIYVLLELIAILIITINVKHTGMVYALLFAGVISLYIFFRTKIKTVAYASMVGILVGIVMVGYNPYITNTIQYKNPFYPVINLNGSENYITTSELPKNFLVLNRYQRLFFSLFSKSQQDREITKFKIPFTVYSRERSPFIKADPRVAGFGPFFSGSILLSITILLIAWLNKVPQYSIGLAFYILVLLSVLINPTSWWARFVPQLWLLPIISIYLALREPKILKLKIFGYFTILVLLANLVFIGMEYFPSQYSNTVMVRNQITYIKTHTPSPIIVDFREYDINRIRFNEMGLKYIEVTDLSNCLDINQIFFSSTYFCNK